MKPVQVTSSPEPYKWGPECLPSNEASDGCERRGGNGRHVPARGGSGPVEGRVNHIKMIKRQMFGRAGLPLLRKRVLLTAQG
jgi:hypothetical protein